MNRTSIDWILFVIISPLFFIILFLMSYSFRLLYYCIMNCIETKKSQIKSNTSATTEAIVIIWPTLSPQQRTVNENSNTDEDLPPNYSDVVKDDYFYNQFHNNKYKRYASI